MRVPSSKKTSVFKVKILNTNKKIRSNQSAPSDTAMAIPFLQPEEDDSARHGNGANGAQAGTGSSSSSSVGGGTSVGNNIAGAAASGSVAVVVAGATGPLPIPNSPAPSGTSTAVQTPLIGPMNGDQLVQLFYEALYRYSRGGKCCSVGF